MPGALGWGGEVDEEIVFGTLEASQDIFYMCTRALQDLAEKLETTGGSTQELLHGLICPRMRRWPWWTFAA